MSGAQDNAKMTPGLDHFTDVGSTADEATAGAIVSSPSSSSSSISTVRPDERSTLWQEQAGYDWRARSVSAPASRSSSFAANLDQLAALSQSAHKFPITLSNSAAPTTQQSLSNGRGNVRRPDNVQNTPTTIPSVSSVRARTPSSSSSTNQSIRIRSTPTSPNSSPTLSTDALLARANSSLHPSAGERSSTNVRPPFEGIGTNASTRARSALFARGSGFTPAHESNTTPMFDSQNSARSGPSSSSSSRGIGRQGRLRSTSASESVTISRLAESRHLNTHPAHFHSSLSNTVQSQRPRAQSARSSPVLQPLQATNSRPLSTHFDWTNGQTDTLRPSGSHSSPHHARISPIILGYPYACDLPAGATFVPASNELGIGGYFALPPSLAMVESTSDASSHTMDNLPPPPYTPNNAESNSPVSRPPLSRPPSRQSLQRQTSTSNRSSGRSSRHEDGSDVDEGETLSFSTSRARASTSFSRSQTLPVASTRSAQNDADYDAARDSGQLRSDTQQPTDIENTSIRDGLGLASPLSQSRLLEGPSLADEEWSYLDRLEHPSKLRRFVLTYLAHPLRLLATVPGSIGTFWLLRNALMVAWTSGALWKTSDARPSALEFALSSLWSLMTAYHALSFTTLLLRRWLHYYSLLPSLIRLVALQALCWPLVRLTLFVFGARNPLPAWILISVTTAISDTVARWVVSNITDESDGLSNASMGIGSPSEERGRSDGNRDSPAINSTVERLGRTAGRRRPYVKRRGGGLVMAFWRAIMGAPPRQRSGKLSASMTAAERGTLMGAVTESEMESDAESLLSPDSARRSTSRNGARRLQSPSLRRRRRPTRRHSMDEDRHCADVLSGMASGGEDGETGSNAGDGDGGDLNLQLQNFERVGRIFHWDVAIKRNVLPIGILAYMTMWILMMEDMRKRLSV